MPSFQRVSFSSYGGPEVLQLETVAQLPEPAPHQVRVRVQAASVSFTDTMVRTGNYLDVRQPPPLTPGYDFVGVVDAVGSAVQQWRVGDRVADLTVIGSYSEYLLRDAQDLVAVPPELDAAQAVTCVLSYTTAYQMLHRTAQVQSGQTILVHAGAGAVGMALIQLGKLHGLRVLCTASAGKHDFVRSLGAEPIDYQRQDFVAAVAELTQGRGVDAVFDTISFSNFKRSFACLNASGFLVAYGVYQATIGTRQKQVGKVLREVLPFFAAKLWWQLTQPKKRSAFYMITAERKKHAQQFQDDLGALFALVAAGKLQPIVDSTLPLAQAAQAHRLVEAAQTRGKIVLLMPEP